MTGLGDGCETRGSDFLMGGDGATAGFDPGGACCGTAKYKTQFHLHIKQNTNNTKILKYVQFKKHNSILTLHLTCLQSEFPR